MMEHTAVIYVGALVCLAANFYGLAVLHTAIR